MRLNPLIEALEAEGYVINRERRTITPPASQPTKRQTQVLQEDYHETSGKANSWLPEALRDRSGRGFKALADRRNAWSAVAKDASPDEVLQSMCSLLAFNMLSDAQKMRLSPDTEL